MRAVYPAPDRLILEGRDDEPCDLCLSCKTVEASTNVGVHHVLLSRLFEDLGLSLFLGPILDRLEKKEGLILEGLIPLNPS